jgi:hypothetical protein
MVPQKWFCFRSLVWGELEVIKGRGLKNMHPFLASLATGDSSAREKATMEIPHLRESLLVY